MILSELFPFISYVNLGPRQDRREMAEEQFHRLGLAVRRQPGVKKERVRDPWGFQNESRYACSLAKRMAIRQAKLAGAPAMLLFEDDLILAPDLHERLSGIELPDDWGIFFLGCKHIERPVPLSPNLLRVTRATDNHAIGIRAKYYDDVIKAMSGTGKGKPRTILYSDAKASMIQRRIPTYAVFPNLAWQGYSRSDNEGAEVTYYDPGGRQRGRREAIQGLEEEISEKFPGAKSPPPPEFTSRESAHHPEYQTPRKRERNLQLEEHFPARFYLNRGKDEGIRLQIEARLKILDLTVRRMSAPDEDSYSVGMNPVWSCPHLASLESARADQATAMMVLQNQVVPSLNFRADAEEHPLPEDWGMLIFREQTGNSLKEGWQITQDVDEPKIYVIRAEHYHRLEARLRTRKPSESIDLILTSLSAEVPTYSLELRSIDSRIKGNVRMIDWLAKYHSAREQVLNFPDISKRAAIVDQFGVDVFALRIREFMQTANLK